MIGRELRDVGAMPVGGIRPRVVRAAQAVTINGTRAQSRAAMRAEVVEHRHGAVARPEHREVAVEETSGHDRAGRNVDRPRDRMPEPTGQVQERLVCVAHREQNVERRTAAFPALVLRLREMSRRS